MKQSNNKKSRDVTAFLYERLSRDDNLEGESHSIGNQKEMFPASSPMTVLQKCPGGMRTSKRSWRRKSKSSAPKSRSRAVRP